MSDYVDRVTFVLHESFSDNVRSVFLPPYETVVLGLFPYVAYIYVHFKDPNVQPQIFQILIDFT